MTHPLLLSTASCLSVFALSQRCSYNVAPFAERVIKKGDVSAAGRALWTHPVRLQISHFSETMSAGLRVSSGVDVLSSLACPIFSIRPTWPIGYLRRMATRTHDILFLKGESEIRSCVVFLIDAATGFKSKAESKLHERRDVHVEYMAMRHKCP